MVERNDFFVNFDYNFFRVAKCCFYNGSQAESIGTGWFAYRPTVTAARDSFPGESSLQWLRHAMA